MIKAAILDVDGTLVDSNDLHAESWVVALTLCGHSVSFEMVRPMIGMGGDRLMPQISGVREDTREGRKISEKRKKIFREDYLDRVRAFPQTRELLLRMKKAGLKLYVASSSGEELLKELLKRARVHDLIDGSTSKDDAESSKPAPDIIEAALKRAGLRPHEAIMVGDTPYDVEAASRAGVGCIALECGGWRREDLSRALAVYHDPADLLLKFDSSPLAAQITAAETFAQANRGVSPQP